LAGRRRGRIIPTAAAGRLGSKDDAMSVDTLRQFCVRAAKTLAVVHDVYTQLMRRDKSISVAALEKFESELASWQSDVDSYETYRLALSQFSAAEAIWSNSGDVGQRPARPKLPEGVPADREVEYVFRAIDRFKSNIREFNRTLERCKSLSERSYDLDLGSLFEILESMSQPVRWMSERVREADEQASEKAVTNDLMTREEIALATGIALQTLKNQSERFLGPPAVNPGRGRGKKLKWHYLAIMSKLESASGNSVPDFDDAKRIITAKQNV
jgi:hypothetical protein